MPDPRPIGVFDSGVGGLTVLREILRRTPAESTIYLGDNARAPYGVAARRGGPRLLDRSRSTRSSSTTSRPSWSPATRRPLSAIGALRRRYDLPVLGVIRPGRLGGRAGHPQPPRRGHRDAGHDPLARLLRGDQGREPGGRGLRARDAGPRAAGRGRRADAGRSPRRPSRRRSARSSASATPTASRSSRGRRARDRHAAARLHALPAAPAGHRGRRRRPGRDRRLRDRDGVGAGRAARHQRARGHRPRARSRRPISS